MKPNLTDTYTCTLPWRTDNTFTLYVDGDQFYPRIFDCIGAATSTVDIEMYLFESGGLSDEVIAILEGVRGRGVAVRLLLDHVGSHGLHHQERQRLTRVGVEIRYFNKLQQRKRLRNLSRDHRKIIVIDSTVAFVGGAGMTDDFSPRHSGADAWHDAMVEIRGPLVHDWGLLFERTWEHYDSIHDEKLRKRLQQALRSEHTPPLRNREVPQGRAVATRGPGNKPIIGSLLSETNKSSRRVLMSTAYFLPSRKLVKALTRAAQRGVDGRLMVPGAKTDPISMLYAGRSWYTPLLQAGVRVYEYQHRFTHLKTALVDDWVTLGSCNFDRWNLQLNLEANLEALDPDLVRQVAGMLEQDLREATEIKLSRWKARSWREKILERFFKWIAGFFINRLPND